jgi:hypothetical protein
MGAQRLTVSQWSTPYGIRAFSDQLSAISQNEKTA